MSSEDEITSPYEILGISEAASTDDVRHAYQRLALRHHPDRGSDAACSSKSHAFVRVQRAYDLLRDPEVRKRYDAEQRAELLRAHATNASRDLPVDIDEMQYEESADAGGGGVWRHTCRCGDEFLLHEAQLLDGIDAIHCRSCSYVLRPLYRVEAPHDADT